MQNRRQPSPKLTPDQFGILLLILSLLLGGWLRFIPALNADFPVNDGGLFYVMIHDLLDNQLALPVTTTYNHLNLPFAYPPLGLFLAALLAQTFQLTPLTPIVWIPPIATTLSIAVVYQLAREITSDPLKAGGTALGYALAPASITWLLMGGGLTRSLGMLFLLLTALSAYRMYWRQPKHGLWITALCGSLTVLSHPDMTLHAISIPVLFFLFARSYKNFVNSLLVGLGVAFLTSPWWLTILRTSGLDPFLQAPRSGFYNLIAILSPLGLFQIVNEKYLPILTLAGLCGLIVTLAKKEYFLPALLALPYLVNPRNADTVAIVPLAMLSAIAIVDYLLPGINSLAKDPHRRISKLLGAYLLIVALGGAYNQMNEFMSTTLSKSAREAMQWVKENTPDNSTIYTITGNPHLFVDPVLEWLPVFADRHNVSTIQGREWVNGSQFFTYAGKIQEAQACYWQGLSCLETSMTNLPKFDYIFLPQKCTGQPNCTGALAEITSPLYLALLNSDYRIVYQNETIAIFENRLK